MDSIFTKILDGDVSGYVVVRTDTVATLLSLEGHPLVVPIHPYSSIADLDEKTAADLMQMIVRVANATKEVTNCDGINIVQSDGAAAGQDVFHVHFHIKPRFKGDEVRLTWDTSTRPEEERAVLASSLSKRVELDN